MKILIILFFLSSHAVNAARFVVEAHYPLNSKQLNSLAGANIAPFAAIEHPYFSRLYSVSGHLSKETLAKLNWVKNIEETVELTKLSLLPSENPQRLVEDELFPYQWSLFNQGQSYVREKDDIHNIPLKGVQGKDIGFSDVLANLPKDRIIVAVLDSGVDLEHPDIKDNLWKNKNECGKDPKVDNDNNQLPGDCHGWNFTEAIDSDEAKSPQDNDGHGTHVAGIIAAAKNGFGIVGVNPNALIMPVKVMKDSHSRSEVAASESFAQGIIYATRMGAHIINLSLGWPRSLETKHLREAIYYALSQNVIIVAAAGNNNSSEPLFPCAYDGVICTAASTLDGKFAGFSNFGGHVDAVAPGEAILSLNPTIFEPEFFPVPGYDIKSGTSQSSPLLAGLISIIKAQDPTLTIDNIFARLYAAPLNKDKKKFVMGGEATYAALSKQISGPVVRPILKRVRQIIMNGKNIETRVMIPVRNYGVEAKNVSIKVKSLSAGVEFQTEPMLLDVLPPSKVSELSFNARITDINAESNIQMMITIVSEEGELSYLNELPVVRDMRPEAEFKKMAFVYNQNPLPMGNIVNGKINSFLSTVESYGKSQKHEFFLRRTLRDEKKMEITILKREDAKIVEAPRKIILDNFVSLVNFIRLDLNFDGKEDYLVQYVADDGESKHFIFAFYDENMNPLWSNFQNVKVILDLSVANMNNLSFTRMDHPELGKILVPAFFTMGQLPKIDQMSDYFGRWDVSRESRLYYLEPLVSQNSLRIRSLTTNVWKEKVKKELGSKWYETVTVENILPVSVNDASKGEVRVIMSVGEGSKRHIFISTFDTKNTLRGQQLAQLVLQTDWVDTLYGITPTGLDAVGDAYLNVYDRSRSKIVTTKETQQVSQLNYIHESETDLIVGHVVSFEKGSEKFSVIQTRDELVSLSQIDGEVIKTTRPKLRYSFFSSKVLSEMYHPVIYQRNNTQSPALYVDSTAVTANRVYLFEEQNGKLVASINNSLIVPSSCKALNPAFSTESAAHEFIFLCLEDKDWVMRSYGMK